MHMHILYIYIFANHRNGNQSGVTTWCTHPGAFLMTPRWRDYKKYFCGSGFNISCPNQDEAKNKSKLEMCLNWSRSFDGFQGKILQETPYSILFNGRNPGSRSKFSLKPIEWVESLCLQVWTQISGLTKSWPKPIHLAAPKVHRWWVEAHFQPRGTRYRGTAVRQLASLPLEWRFPISGHRWRTTTEILKSGSGSFKYKLIFYMYSNVQYKHLKTS